MGKAPQVIRALVSCAVALVSMTRADAQVSDTNPLFSALGNRAWTCLETAYDAQSPLVSIEMRTDKALRDCDADVKEFWEAIAGRAEADRVRTDRTRFMVEFKALAEKRLADRELRQRRR